MVLRSPAVLASAPPLEAMQLSLMVILFEKDKDEKEGKS